MAQHALIGPSSFKRALICARSVREIAHLPRRSNKAAAEGTMLHEIAADCLIFGLDPYDFVGDAYTVDGHDFVVTVDDAECMVEGIDWIRQQDAEVWVEQRVSLDPWLPGQFGTGDLGLWYPKTGVFVVFDWKFGAGVPVKVRDNVQLLGYGLGFKHSILDPRGIKPTTYRMIIEQPRNHEGGRYYDHWDVTPEELLAFGDVLKDLWVRVNDPNTPFVPSAEGCMFCDKLLTPEGCRAYEEWMFDMLGDEFEEPDDLTMLLGEPPKLVTLPNTDTITPARRFYIVQHRALIVKWLGSLYAASMAAAAAGDPDPGSKVVAGKRGARYYTDKKKAELILTSALGEDAWNKTLIGITAATKALKPTKKSEGDQLAFDSLNDVVQYGNPKPILVQDTDPRPALDDFEAEIEDMDDAEDED